MSQQGLSSLNISLGDNFGTKALGIIVAGCNQRAGKFSRRKVESDNGAQWCEPEPRRLRERVEELGLASLTDAEDKPRKVESKEFHRLRCDKMIFHGLTIQFEVVKVLLDMCKPMFGSMARLTRVTRHCTDKPTFSWWFMLDKHSLKPRLLVDAYSPSDESTRKSSSSDEAEFYMLNLACAAESLVPKYWKGMQLEHTDGQTSDRLGLMSCKRSREEVWTEEK